MSHRIIVQSVTANSHSKNPRNQYSWVGKLVPLLAEFHPSEIRIRSGRAPEFAHSYYVKRAQHQDDGVADSLAMSIVFGRWLAIMERARPCCRFW